MVMDTIETISDADLYWLAGLLEGEASFMTPKPGHPTAPRLALNMVDEDIVARVASLLGVSYHVKAPQQEGWQPQFCINLVSYRAADWMRLLRPLMGVRRQAQIDTALGMIPTHYPDPCLICGVTIPIIIGRRGPRPRYCRSDECQAQARRHAQARYRANKRERRQAK